MVWAVPVFHQQGPQNSIFGLYHLHGGTTMLFITNRFPKGSIKTEEPESVFPDPQSSPEGLIA
jgi:hypothetical protein